MSSREREERGEVKLLIIKKRVHRTRGTRMILFIFTTRSFTCNLNLIMFDLVLGSIKAGLKL